MNEEMPGPSARTGARAPNTLPAEGRYEHPGRAARTSGVLVGDAVHASFDRRDPVVRSAADEEDDSTDDLGSLRLAAELHGVGVGGRRRDADVHALRPGADAHVVRAGPPGLDPLAA